MGRRDFVRDRGCKDSEGKGVCDDLVVSVFGNMKLLCFVTADAFGMIWEFLKSKSPAPVLLETLSLPQMLRRTSCAF